MATPSHVEPVGEERFFDYMFELWPERGSMGLSVYNIRETLPRAECYVTIDGKCYRVTAERHPHPYEDA